MTIIGIGIDIIEIIRIQKNIFIYNDKLAKRILSHNEWTDYLIQKNKSRFLAKKFAIKEAASKAFGTGISKKITFNKLEHYKDKKGKPKLSFLKEALVISKIMQINFVHLSITDEKNYTCALVIFEK